MIAGISVSYVVKCYKELEDLPDPDLFSPPVANYLKKKRRKQNIVSFTVLNIRLFNHTLWHKL